MAGETDAEPQEAEFRRRWYEAHARRAQADIDQGHFKDWLPDLWTAGSEALKIRDRLASSGDLDAFKAEQDAWARANDVGFKGQIGAMFINSLVKNTDDRASLTGLLVSGLTAPTNRDSAAQKLDALVDHVNRIKVGAHPAPLSAAFTLSYFWALQQRRRWPIFWPNDRRFLAATTGTKFSGSPTEQYMEFVDLVAEFDEDCERFARVSSWWIEQQPVFLDPVLVDRCDYGAKNRNEESIEGLKSNADVMVAIAKYLGQAMVENLSEAATYTLKAWRPPVLWTTNGWGRPDLWVDWRVEETQEWEISLRLWINHKGAALGVMSGWGKNWKPKAQEAIESTPVDGFRIMERGDEDDMGFYGRAGTFLYGRSYETDELADLDLQAEAMRVATAARPVLDALVSRAQGDGPPGTPPAADPLSDAVAEFRRDTAYPTPHDAGQKARQPRLREILRPDSLATTDRAELRKIWTTGAYGFPGPQANLNKTLRDADEVEYEQILRTLEYLCWGGGDDADRVDRVLDDPEYKVKGLGETVIFKLLAICYPDRYLCVYPYSGESGKLRMLRALDLAEPAVGTSRGRKHVESNNRLWERLEPHFPGDPWGMMCFLYWYIDYLDREETPIGEPTPIEAAATDLLVEGSFLDDIVELLRDKGQVILYGPPGTGKTYLAQRLAAALAPDPADRALVQFHPSSSYEDFFEGYRPDVGPDGQIVYELTPGPLALMAERAARHPQRRQVMVIDEINRANLPKVLGELLFLFEYRDKSISTLYRPEGEFELPESLWFIGTMNTADRSIALVDAALRRRFHFVPFFPDRGPIEGLLDRWLEREDQPSWVGELVAMVNDELTESLGGDLQLGASHFMKKDYGDEPDENDPTLGRIWRFNIEPFIEDQFFGNEGQINKFRLGQVVQRYRSQSGRDDPREPAVGGNG
ncbi:MAG: AAA domain-containing protein [Acidimicrobiia bacterium]|nr:AAA domain-containing protein [Acidimicrobiia bacterium]